MMLLLTVKLMLIGIGVGALIELSL